MSRHPANITRIEFRRERYLRGYMYDFIQLLAPQWNCQTIDQATQAGEPHSCQSQS